MKQKILTQIKLFSVLTVFIFFAFYCSAEKEQQTFGNYKIQIKTKDQKKQLANYQDVSSVPIESDDTIVTPKSIMEALSVKPVPGVNNPESEKLDNAEITEEEAGNDKTGNSETSESFAEFSSLLSTAIPEKEKIKMKSELDKLSKDKEFVKDLSPEQMSRIKADIAKYKKQIQKEMPKKQVKKTNIKDLKRKLIIKTDGSDSVAAVAKVQDYTENQEGEIKADKKKNGKITFNFPNVKLEEFARFIANLNKKILIGANLLQGNVTIKTPRELSLKELMAVFEALLNSNGLSYMISGDYMQVFQKSDSEVKVYKINYLKSADVAKSLSDIFKMSFNVGGVPQRIMINSLDQANAIVVLAPKEKHVEIGQAIKKMDWRRRQVLLEIRVLELTYTDNFGFGVTGGVKNLDDFVGGVGQNVTNGKGPAPAFGDDATPYSGVAYDNGQFFVNLEATKQFNDLKILSQPKILTAENQKAEIKIGKKQPIVSSSMDISTTGQGTPVSKTDVDWKDIGIDINITPRINANRDVSLDFKLEITAIVSHVQLFGQDDYPIIGQRLAQNSSTIMDNQMLVIGGLLESQKKVQKDKVPFFGELPYLGWLFSTTVETAEQTEIMILIKPRVIENVRDGLKVTKQTTEKFKNYDPANKEVISEMLKGKRDGSWDLFNIYQYFNNGKYREEQNVVPQEWGNWR